MKWIQEKVFRTALQAAGEKQERPLPLVEIKAESAAAQLIVGGMSAGGGIDGSGYR